MTVKNHKVGGEPLGHAKEFLKSIWLWPIKIFCSIFFKKVSKHLENTHIENPAWQIEFASIIQMFAKDNKAAALRGLFPVTGPSPTLGVAQRSVQSHKQGVWKEGAAVFALLRERPSFRFPDSLHIQVPDLEEL